MPRKIFLIKSLLLSLVIIGNVFAAEITIIPLKKPILGEAAQSIKIIQGILKPKSKPSKKIEEPKTTIVKKDLKKINFLIPKSKPLVVKKSKSAVKSKSKYYSQKDYGIAKKSIAAMQKSQWLKQAQNTTAKKIMALQKNLFKQWKKVSGQQHYRILKKLRTNLYIILFNGDIY